MGSAPTVSPLRIPYVVAAGSALLLMSAAIYLGNRWALDFMHVLGGGLWSGIDLFMGFVIGPILRRLPLESRKAMIEALVPRTLFLMPTLSIVTTTTGWFLALQMELFDVGYPQFYWVVAALVIVTMLTVQGLGVLLPTNLRIYFEMQKQHPDSDKMARWMYVFVRVVAIQGTMQVAIIVVMARFATGL